MAHLQAEEERLNGLAVVAYLDAHQAEGPARMERYVLAGQLALFCDNCGRIQTIDRINAEAVKGREHAND